MRGLITILMLLPLFTFGQLGQSISSGSGITKGLYRFNGDANDVSGNANNGTTTNISYNYAGGGYERSAAFNGTNSLIVSAANIGISGTSAFTISIWVKPSIDSAGQIYIYWGANTTRAQIAFLTTYYYHDDICITYGGGADYVYTDIQRIKVNEWQNIIVTKSGENINTTAIYYNGWQCAVSVAGGGNTNITNNKLSIGNSNGRSGNFPVNGSIDEVIIENIAWDAAKVKRYYTYSKGRFGIQ